MEPAWRILFCSHKAQAQFVFTVNLLLEIFINSVYILVTLHIKFFTLCPKTHFVSLIDLYSSSNKPHINLYNFGLFSIVQTILATLHNDERL